MEQRSGANQVNAAINQLNEATQQNAAAAEELASGSVQFIQQSEKLRQIIDFFKLNTSAELNYKEELIEKLQELIMKTELKAVEDQENLQTNITENLKQFQEKINTKSVEKNVEIKMPENENSFEPF
jgi:hypothetical protein